jgi:hypothetical protein
MLSIPSKSDSPKKETLNHGMILQDISPADSTSSLSDNFQLPQSSGDPEEPIGFFKQGGTGNLFDDAQHTDTLDMSTTTDIEDCIKILDEAEKKVGQAKPQLSTMGSLATWNIIDTTTTSPAVPASSFTSSVGSTSQVSSTFGVSSSVSHIPATFGNSKNSTFVSHMGSISGPTMTLPASHGFQSMMNSSVTNLHSTFSSAPSDRAVPSSSMGAAVSFGGPMRAPANPNFGSFMAHSYGGQILNNTSTANSLTSVHSSVARSDSARAVMSNPSEMANGPPSRPASTSTLQNMLNTLASVDPQNDANRSSSAPPTNVASTVSHAHVDGNRNQPYFGGGLYNQVPRTTYPQSLPQTRPLGGDQSLRNYSQMYGFPPSNHGSMYFGQMPGSHLGQTSHSLMNPQMMMPSSARLPMGPAGGFGRPNMVYPGTGSLGQIPEENMHRGFHP